MVALAIAGPGSAVAQGPPYPDAILATPGLDGYWRLGEASGTAAADASGRAGAGSYAGAPGLGARGAVRADDDTAARFDGVDDEVQVSGAPSATAATLEGWFFWEAGVALLRDATGSAGWILAYDSGGKVAYRVGGSTFTSTVATASVRDGWHHVAVTVDDGATRLYVDGAPVHSGTVTGAPAPALPWHVMRNGTTAQFTRGRAGRAVSRRDPRDAGAGGVLAAGRAQRHRRRRRQRTCRRGQLRRGSGARRPRRRAGR